MSQFSLCHGYDFHSVQLITLSLNSAFSTWVGSDGGVQQKGSLSQNGNGERLPHRVKTNTSHTSSSLSISATPKLFCQDFEPEHPNVQESRSEMHRSAPSFGSRDDTLPVTALELQASDSCNHSHKNLEVTKKKMQDLYNYCHQPSLRINNNLLKFANHCSSCWNWLLCTIRLNL